MRDTVTSVQNDDTASHQDQEAVGKFLLQSGGERYEVEWDSDAKVTSMGSLVFFAQYLHTAGLIDGLCADTPLAYRSNNAPRERDVFGTVILSILNGQTRYAHINTLRGDRVGAEMLGVTKVVSEDSVRRALQRGTPEAWDTWLAVQERAVYAPLLTEPYVLDIDNTVKPLYGHQEGAEVGYNPQKPGRPNHNYHTYFIGELRLVLGVEVLPGKQHAGKHSMPGLWRILDDLPEGNRPRFIRGDVAYGNENIMIEAEKRAQPYLFKLRQTSKVKALIKELDCHFDTWKDAGCGWQGSERELQLHGWTRARRCIVLRRPTQRAAKSNALPSPTEPEFDFVEELERKPIYEYMVLVTNDTMPVVSLSQLYRDRADCENVIDEIKNQWGWGGFVTRDLDRCRIIARLVALVYNWWNIFARLANPEKHQEAITSRPLLLHAVGRVVTSGRQKSLRLTSTHSLKSKISYTLNRISRFLSELTRTAEQLGTETIWAIILSAAFIKWLGGRLLNMTAKSTKILKLLRY